MLNIMQARQVIALSFLSLLVASVAAAEPTGEWWEITMNMEMPGMPAEMAGMMGGQASKICMLKGQEKEPAKSEENKNCTMSNVKYSGNTTSFKMKCTGKDAMTGDAVLTHTPNSFSQKMNMQSKDGEMTMISNGKRIGGACKGDEQINEAFSGAAESVAENCQQALDNNDYPYFINTKNIGTAKNSCGGMPTAASRKNCEAASDVGCAKLRPKMCARLSADLKTQESYKNVANKPGAAEMASECGLSFAKITQQFCNDSLDKKDWQFVGGFCREQPEVVALRKQHCAGRNYTSVDAKHRAMCSAIGFGGGGDRRSVNADERPGDSSNNAVAKEKATSQPTAPDESNVTDTMKNEGVKEGMDALKNIFKF